MIGAALEGIGSEAVLRIPGESEAGGAGDDPALDREGFVEASPEALQYAFGVVGGFKRHDNEELVAADAGEHIARALGREQALADLLQIEVADPVAVAIVHFLELVDVDVDEGEPIAVKRDVVEGGAEAHLAEAAVGELREGVVG